MMNASAVQVDASKAGVAKLPTAVKPSGQSAAVSFADVIDAANASAVGVKIGNAKSPVALAASCGLEAVAPVSKPVDRVISAKESSVRYEPSQVADDTAVNVESDATVAAPVVAGEKDAAVALSVPMTAFVQVMPGKAGGDGAKHAVGVANSDVVKKSAGKERLAEASIVSADVSQAQISAAVVGVVTASSQGDSHHAIAAKEDTNAAADAKTGLKANFAIKEGIQTHAVKPVVNSDAVEANSTNDRGEGPGGSSVGVLESKVAAPIEDFASSSLSQGVVGATAVHGDLLKDGGFLRSGRAEGAMPVEASQASIASNEMMLHRYEAATPNRLEVGVSSGSLGWVSVRAELSSDGSVHALLRSSSETASVLRAQKGEISSFLQAQAVPVGHIAVETSKFAMAAPTAFSGSVGQNAANGGAQSEQRQSASRPGNAGKNSSGAEEDVEIVSEPLAVSAANGMALASTGGWLSVRV